MRIPTSVIVMSLLTAAPFAMAVRDTLNGKDKPALDDDWGDESISSERERELLAEYEAERARELEERERQREQNVARLDQLFDATAPARMGALLDGVVLGGVPGTAVAERAQERVDRESEHGFLWVDFQYDANRLQRVTVSIADSRDYDSERGVIDHCLTLKDKLVAAWGPSTSGVWVNPQTHDRAALEQSPCSLAFERSVPVAEWLATVPFDALGKPAERQLEKYAAARGIGFEEYEEEIARWSMPGIGFGRGATSYEAYIENEKIVGVRIVTDTDFDTLVSLREALSAKLRSTPTYDEDYETWTWKRAKVTLTNYNGGSRFVVLIGKDPYE